MAVTNFLVTSLPAYVQENRDLIIANFALSGDSRRYMGLMTGVKGKANLNILTATPAFQDGKTCGFDPLDSIAIAPRTVEVAPIKVQGEICPQTLLGTWGEYLVRLNAQEIKRELPFEGYLVEAITNEIKKKIERLIWRGEKGQNDPIDGIIRQIADTPGVEEKTIDCCADGCSSETPNVFGALQQIFAEVPENVAERGLDIFLAPQLYRLFALQLMKANLYHFAPEAGYPETIILPGTDARVIKANGLEGSYTAVATFRRNFVYATDMEGDEEVFDIWWSNDNRVFRYEVLWSSGVGIVDPSLAYLYTLICTAGDGGDDGLH